MTHVGLRSLRELTDETSQVDCWIEALANACSGEWEHAPRLPSLIQRWPSLMGVSWSWVLPA